MSLSPHSQQIGDQIAEKLTPDEREWFEEVRETLATCDHLITLNQRLIRWARQDPENPRAVQENIYTLVGEIERLIGR
jgi:hypothetical protein